MRPDQVEILKQIAATGRVPPKTFVGRGMVVYSLVTQGYLEWERGRSPISQNATALLITEAGRSALLALSRDHLPDGE
jgi:hypothetical protein